MRASDFDYSLPPSVIAQEPLPDRSASRLLVLERASGAIRHARFPDLIDFVAAEDVVVLNVSRVIPARLHGKRETVNVAELLVIRDLLIGQGTFKPVEVDDLARHRMEPEPYVLGAEAAASINGRREAGGRVWAVGTTVVRALETCADEHGVLRPSTGETRLFIYPPYAFRVVDRLLTNFHLPRSTLLMLVCAFAGYDHVMRAYREAISAGYRFYSYGDAMAVI